MTKRVLDYDPLTGETVYWDWKDGDSLSITHVQDVTHILDGVSELRNEEDYSKAGIKQDNWHYARIPNVVMMEMKSKHGVDMMASPIDWKAVFRCINAHYPWLKATTKMHA